MLTPRITDYKIIKYSDSWKLEREVRGYIKEGWQPLGSLAVTLYATSSSYESTKEYSQAIVKYEHQKPNSI